MSARNIEVHVHETHGEGGWVHSTNLGCVGRRGMNELSLAVVACQKEIWATRVRIFGHDGGGNDSRIISDFVVIEIVAVVVHIVVLIAAELSKVRHGEEEMIEVVTRGYNK
jgi:hypothetical protein